MSSNCIVALDIDGTLIPILVDFEKLRREVRTILGINHSLKPLGESLASLEISRDLKTKAWELIEKAEEVSVEYLNPDELVDNVRFVEHLRSLGVEVFFVTMRSSRTARKVLNKLKLHIEEPGLVTRDLSPYRKEQLKHIIERAKGKKVVFIGDTVYDKEAAKDLGIPFILVSNYKELPRVLSEIVKLCEV